ncbi:sulfotransferase domain-containing protein [Nocardiopsis sp. NRRL B-16309]|uniref:sulfotransferase domain-containing protein n=1 Tax=Nocardiopsis sp. NRRL B-16309 TaxID=1519494 RepID=UPI0006AF5BE3|nr:sulfotransferase domain-containing protein [Nocardiopsis sp. NRRL B-16309]KOX20806.1 sulfotransferase [Nocardiopsis sp. NRRL B-16309]
MPRDRSPVPLRRLAERGRRALLPLSDAWGTATAPTRALPDFLICGAQRAGTTSLFKALALHPCAVGPTLRKGVHYFDTDYRDDLDHYRARFPARSRLRPRGGRPRVRVFESSPYYLFHPLAAERIARDLPWVRVVVILRDPVERAYSAHAHETARGFEDQPFEKALELESQRLAGEEERLAADPDYRSHSHQHHAYAARGRYVDQLLRMERHLGRDRVHVVDHADLFDGTGRALAEIERFVGLRPGSGRSPGRHNARVRGRMPESLREELSARFADSDARLAEWWGRTPSWRR